MLKNEKHDAYFAAQESQSRSCKQQSFLAASCTLGVTVACNGAKAVAADIQETDELSTALDIEYCMMVLFLDS